MNKAISISLFRVSGDSKYLDMIFSCPFDYYFTSLQLEVKYVEKGMMRSEFFDLSPALFHNEGDEDSTKDQKHWTVRLPLDKLGISVPAIYVGLFKAKDEELGRIEDSAICSDVNFAYRCMLDDILNRNGKCDEISDDALRKYLLLYGHQASLNTRDLETAERYFRYIGNCFNNCPSKERSQKNNSSCNCGK